MLVCVLLSSIIYARSRNLVVIPEKGSKRAFPSAITSLYLSFMWGKADWVFLSPGLLILTPLKLKFRKGVNQSKVGYSTFIRRLFDFCVWSWKCRLFTELQYISRLNKASLENNIFTTSRSFPWTAYDLNPSSSHVSLTFNSRHIPLMIDPWKATLRGDLRTRPLRHQLLRCNDPIIPYCYNFQTHSYSNYLPENFAHTFLLWLYASCRYIPSMLSLV